MELHVIYDQRKGTPRLYEASPTPIRHSELTVGTSLLRRTWELNYMLANNN